MITTDKDKAMFIYNMVKRETNKAFKELIEAEAAIAKNKIDIQAHQKKMQADEDDAVGNFGYHPDPRNETVHLNRRMEDKNAALIELNGILDYVVETFLDKK